MIHHSFKSPNFSKRKQPIDSILLHHTGGEFPGCLWWLCNPESHVSCHYVVTQQGQIYQLVDDKHKAWHAGRGYYDLNSDGRITKDEENFNNRSIGIELEAVEPYGYGEFQIESLDWLVKFLLNKHNIPIKNILAHKEIASYRGKFDPANFSMDEYRSKIGRQLGLEESLMDYDPI